MRALTLGAFLVFAGCVTTPPSHTGEPAPNLLLLDVDGVVIDLHTWHGTPVLLEVFGVHCGSCASMMPELLAYWDAYGADDTVRMLSVDLGPNFDGLGARNVDEVRAWREQWQANWTFALDDETGQANEKYPHVARPTTYLIGADGILAWRHGGYATFEVLQEETEKILPPKQA